MSEETLGYRDVLILVADDCPEAAGVEPPVKETPTIVRLEYELISKSPYKHTQAEVLFLVDATRKGIAGKELKAQKAALWEGFFSKSRACLRASNLGRRYGWGVHFDAKGRAAVYGVESEKYRELMEDESIKKVKAMRSKRG